MSGTSGKCTTASCAVADEGSGDRADHQPGQGVAGRAAGEFAEGALFFQRGHDLCVGAPLARLEGRLAFTALLQRFPDITLAVDDSELRWP
ncbi:hypothetical protein ACFXG4_45740 [Nocardia sp. NPDC059246]|uniref:hypothetical protein n=1 Tax=unclassified Nocardia TaxID=2637762 RepID=UPI003685E6F0